MEKCLFIFLCLCFTFYSIFMFIFIFYVSFPVFISDLFIFIVNINMHYLWFKYDYIQFSCFKFYIWFNFHVLFSCLFWLCMWIVLKTIQLWNELNFTFIANQKKVQTMVNLGVINIGIEPTAHQRLLRFHL